MSERYHIAVKSHYTPFAYYRLGDTSGTAAVNELGNPAYDGTYVGSPVLNTAELLTNNGDAAVTFNGSTQYIDIGSFLGQVLDDGNASATTVCAWIKPDVLPSAGNFATIWSIIVSGTSAGVLLQLTETGVRLAGRSQAADSLQSDSPTVTISTTEPSFVVGVIDFAGDTVEVFVNGISLGSQAVTFGATTFTTGSRTVDDCIGGNAGGTTDLFKGVLDEALIYAYALPARVIARLYYIGTAAYENYALEAMSSLPAAYWRLGELSGTDAVEEKAGHDGTYTGGCTLGQAGALQNDSDKAVVLDGTNDHVTVADHADLSITTNLSVEFWFKRAATPTISDNEGLVAKWTTTANQRSYAVYLNTSGYLVGAVSSDGTATTTVTGATNLADDAWHHVVLVYVPSASLTLYVDGVQHAQNTTSIPATVYDSAAAVWIGCQGDTSDTDLFLPGSIDEVAVYDRSVPLYEVRRHYLVGLASYEGFPLEVMAHNPDGYWRLGELSGTAAADETGDLDGVYVNSPTLGVDSLVTSESGNKSITLDGANHYVTVADLPACANDSYTFGCYFKPTAMTRLHGLMSHGDRDLSSGGWTLLINASDFPQFAFSDGTNTATATSTAALTVDTPYMIVATVDRTADEVNLYVNSGLVATASSSTVGSLSSLINNATLGVYYKTSFLGYSLGTLDDAFVIPGALALSDIVRLRAQAINYVGAQRIEVSITELTNFLETTATAYQRIVELTDNAKLNEANFAAYVTLILSDVLAISDTIAQADYKVALSDALSLLTSLLYGVPVTLTDGLSASEVIDLALHLGKTDVFRATDGVQLSWSEQLVDVIHTVETLIRDMPLTLEDGAGVSDFSTLDTALSLVEVALGSDTSATLRDVPVAAEELTKVDETLSPALSAFALLAEGGVFGGVLRVNGTEYNVWVTNTHTLGTSRYTGYNFNSIAGNLGARDDGIYLLEGSDDAGTQIDAYVETGLMDFETQNRKTVPYVYAALTGDGRTLLKVTTSEDGQLVTDWYEAQAIYSGPDNMRWKTGKGLKARYWKFRLENVAGSDFDLSDVQAMPVRLSRRL